MSDTKKKVTELTNELKNLLDSEKAEDIVIIDLEGKTAIADYMIVASGLNKRHVGSLGDSLTKFMKNEKGMQVNAEGKENCEWVLVDCFDIIVHIFQPHVRETYKLEELWNLRTTSN